MRFILFILGLLGALWLGVTLPTDLSGVVWGFFAGALILALFTGFVPLGFLAFYALVLGVTAYLIGPTDPATATQVVVATGDAAPNVVLVILSSATQAPYAFSALPPLAIFLTFCLLFALVEADWNFTAFAFGVFSFLFFVVGSTVNGHFSQFLISLVVAVIGYVIFAYFYGVIWHTSKVEERYKPWHDFVENFVQKYKIVLPEDMPKKDFDPLEHLSEDQKAVFVRELKQNPEALQSSRAAQEQSVRGDFPDVFVAMFTWPGLAFGDLLTGMVDFISNNLKGVLTKPFRKRTAREMGTIRSVEELEK